MRRALALIAGTTLLLAAGCGQSSSQRPAVARYIRQVNGIEQQLTPPLATITKLGAQFAHAQGVSGSSLSGFLEQSTMSTARSRIAGLRAKLASLRAPAPASHLRALLLQVIDGQVQISGQLQKLVVFLPRFNAALAPLGSDIRQLESVLTRTTAYGSAAVAEVYAQKQAALQRFQGSMRGILAMLRRLQPPPVSKPDYEAQVHALSGMATSAGRLANALVAGPQGNLAPLLAAFDRAASSVQTRRVQHAHATAVKVYDRQIAQLSSLAHEADAERLRLANTLQ